MPDPPRDEVAPGEPAPGISPLRLLILLVLLLPALALGLWFVSLAGLESGARGNETAKWLVLLPVLATSLAIVWVAQWWQRRRKR